MEQSMSFAKDCLRLYAVTDAAWASDERSLAWQVEQAILGGATIIQYREKHKSFSEMQEEAGKIQAI